MGTKLTAEMIADLPAVDVHVHVPGVITPHMAWELGVRNRFITIEPTPDGRKTWNDGPKRLPLKNPHEHYSDIFRKDARGHIALDGSGKPVSLEYNIDPRSFKDFDRVMATVQGHRHPPGGIQTPDDFRYVMDEYLKHCKEQNVIYAELQQNIRIAHQLYPELPPGEARREFYALLEQSVAEFKQGGVTLRFLHCFNKTATADVAGDTAGQRTIEAADWLKEAQDHTPGVFVGMQSAGHEKDETGWPQHLHTGYEKARAIGMKCDAHAGEGIGVEHMVDVIRTLPMLERLGHGFQVIECPEAIALVHEIQRTEGRMTLVMMPLMNMALGSPVHRTDGKPTAKNKGGQPHYIEEVWQHPFFELLREHKLNIALGTDNPALGAVPYKEMVTILAGLSPQHPFPQKVTPLTAEELALCNLNAIGAAFCEAGEKKHCVDAVRDWMTTHHIKASHHLLNNRHQGRCTITKPQLRT